LEGKVIFEITVSPVGRVSKVNLVSSELQHPELENNILQLIYRFYFVNSGKKEYSIVYPMHFLPPKQMGSKNEL
jgi:TonB family protein